MTSVASEPNDVALADVPRTAAQHFRLAMFGVIARFIDSCADGDVGSLVEAQPFLVDYLDQIDARTPPGDSYGARWRAALDAWEADAVSHSARLPLLALRRAGLSDIALELMLAVGLVEEDPRFGDVFAALQDGVRRPTVGLITGCWRGTEAGEDLGDEIRRAFTTLIDHGLVQIPNAEVARAEWTPVPAEQVWDVLRGESPAVRGWEFHPPASLPDLANYIVSDERREACLILPALLAHEPRHLLIVRGPTHNGRTTLAGAVARALGKALLMARAAVLDDETAWRRFAVIATLSDAVPVIRADLSPGETRQIPPLPLCDAPLVVVGDRYGAWRSADSRPVVTIDLPLPPPEQRLAHWRAALPAHPAAGAIPLEELALARRLTSGGIRRTAAAAVGLARLTGRDVVNADDVRRACRTLESARLETIATRLTTQGALHDLIVDDETREEIESLVARCRYREPLAGAGAAVAQCNVGVRALFAGPTGTGKTLAARLLAGSLGKDLYRVDLSATVNKYLGETEKNLDRVFSAAEELDVVLLLDEGDALMAGRTDVGSSNDRYANLETNFLLQRIESFDGILVVTSNAADRIDRAFARRMDVVVPFKAPDEWRRFELLKLHLGTEALDDGWLQDVACRCALSGGQLRNVAADARLFAMRDDSALRERHVYAALAREYRKRGALCPLRPVDPARSLPMCAG